MKSLQEHTNTMKAKLLFDLFPEEMPALLAELEKVCSAFVQYRADYAKNWDDGFMPFEFWFSLTQQTSELLKKHGQSMKKSSRVFSEQLFFGYTALFVNDRIIKYAEKVSKHEKFKLAVQLIYT